MSTPNGVLFPYVFQGAAVSGNRMTGGTPGGTPGASDGLGRGVPPNGVGDHCGHDGSSACGCSGCDGCGSSGLGGGLSALAAVTPAQAMARTIAAMEAARRTAPLSRTGQSAVDPSCGSVSDPFSGSWSHQTK